MGKKKNKQRNNEFENNDNVEFQDYSRESQGDYPIQYPSHFDREYLSKIDDDELHNIGRALSESIIKVNRMNLNPYPWEIEMCYVQQEIQTRAERRSAHNAWIVSAHAKHEQQEMN